MRAAVISDTHMPRGERALPARCVELLRGADAILHAGDLMTVAVLRELEALGPPVYAVHGNVDEAALRMELPEARVVELGGSAIGTLHYYGQRRGPPAANARGASRRAPSSGHSHVPFPEQAEGFQIFTPALDRAPARARSHHGLATREAAGPLRARVHLMPM